jgi:hypothetical protein
MDLEAWRKERIGQRAMDYARSGAYHSNHDPEALLALAGQRIGALDPRWNQQPGLFLDPYAVVLPYPRHVS